MKMWIAKSLKNWFELGTTTNASNDKFVAVGNSKFC